MCSNACILTAALNAFVALTTAYPVTYESCGVSRTISESPSRVITMNQGVTEFFLAMGLEARMVGTAYLDDFIWPEYAAAYATIPVLASGYPNETTIMDANPDFIAGSYRSAFREKGESGGRIRGIFSNETVGPCIGAGSEYSDSSYNTCRPQLHAAGVSTWLEPASCEDASLRPSTTSDQTVFDALRQLGEIFNVQAEAEQIISEMEADFDAAERLIVNAGFPGSKLDAVWLDCIGCCDDGEVYVGGGTGAPNMLMREAGMENLFADRSGSWACVNETEVISANPDVMVVVHASWDTAQEKLNYLFNHADFCAAQFVQQAKFVTIPFSASTLSPRNGKAALDLAAASIHVNNGEDVQNYESGVEFLDPEELKDETMNLLCPLNIDDVVYAPSPAPQVRSNAAMTIVKTSLLFGMVIMVGFAA